MKMDKALMGKDIPVAVLRNNYINSNSIPENCKKEIKLILNSYLTTDVKCKKISQILIKIFNK